MQPTTRHEIVSLAASTLDRLDRAWFERVNTNTLNLASIQSCVLGQAFRHNDGYFKVVEVWTREPRLAQHAVFASNANYREHWVEEIERRRGVQPPPVVRWTHRVRAAAQRVAALVF